MPRAAVRLRPGIGKNALGDHWTRNGRYPQFRPRATGAILRFDGIQLVRSSFWGCVLFIQL